MLMRACEETCSGTGPVRHHFCMEALHGLLYDVSVTYGEPEASVVIETKLCSIFIPNNNGIDNNALLWEENNCKLEQN